VQNILNYMIDNVDINDKYNQFCIQEAKENMFLSQRIDLDNMTQKAEFKARDIKQKALVGYKEFWSKFASKHDYKLENIVSDKTFDDILIDAIFGMFETKNPHYTKELLSSYIVDINILLLRFKREIQEKLPEFILSELIKVSHMVQLSQFMKMMETVLNNIIDDKHDITHSLKYKENIMNIETIVL